MIAAAHRIASRIKGDPEPVICGICRRRAWGYGWGTNARSIMWICDDPGCMRVMKDVYTMPKCELDEYEAQARDEAGEMGGKYLDSTGKNAFDELTADEWETFLHQVLVGFEISLRRRFLSRAASN